MKEILSPVQWAEHFNNEVLHKLFRTCILKGVRIACEENNNTMLLVQTPFNEMYWVYDYETEIIKPL